MLAAIVRGSLLVAEKVGSTRNEMALLALQNQRLLELDALRDSFVSVVSHELRTPLTSVCGYLGSCSKARAGR